MTYVNIGNEIFTLLDEITELQAVYNKEPAELERYPCATVSASAHENQAGDTAANIRRFSFIIRLYYKLDGTNDAEAILRDMADKVIAKIESNVSLNGSCDYARPTRGIWTQGEREVPIKVVEITVDAFKKVNR